MDALSEHATKTAGEVADILLTAIIEVIGHPIMRMDVGVPEGLTPDPEEAFYTGVQYGLALALTLAKSMGDQAHFTLEEANVLLERMQSIDHTG